MKTKPLVGLVFLLLLSACTPRVTLQGPPSQFCPCMTLPLTYELDGADSATWIIDPASATQPGTETPSLQINTGRIQSAHVRLCQTATITLRATNGNGSSQQSTTYTAYTGGEVTHTGALAPYCPGGRFNGWLHNPGLTTAYPAGFLIQSLQLTTDREGTFSTGRSDVVAAIPGPGVHLITLFNRTPLAASMFFNGPLRVNEACADAGSVLPIGTTMPPNQTVLTQLSCPR